MRYFLILILSVFVNFAYAQTEVTTTAPAAPAPEAAAPAAATTTPKATPAKKKVTTGNRPGVTRVAKVYRGRRERAVARGYRIQVYSGAGGTKSKVAANEVAAKVRKRFPGMSVYCRFKTPRWVCRVGDFSTKEAAEFYLNKIRLAKISSEASIVIDDVLLPK